MRLTSPLCQDLGVTCQPCTIYSAYVQVVIEKGQTLFFDGPEKRFPELKNCNDWVKYGYGYYIGVPWSVGQLKGTWKRE